MEWHTAGVKTVESAVRKRAFELVNKVLTARQVDAAANEIEDGSEILARSRFGNHDWRISTFIRAIYNIVEDLEKEAHGCEASVIAEATRKLKQLYFDSRKTLRRIGQIPMIEAWGTGRCYQVILSRLHSADPEECFEMAVDALLISKAAGCNSDEAYLRCFAQHLRNTPSLCIGNPQRLNKAILALDWFEGKGYDGLQKTIEFLRTRTG